MSASPAPAIDIDDLSVVLSGRLILDAVSATIRSGESVALLGPNGSGKSTLIKSIVGLIPSTSGQVRLLGVPVSQRRSVPWSSVAYVPQRVGAAAGIPATALEVVRSGLLSPGRPFADRGRQARERALQALDAVGLAHRAHDHVQVFSGGQTQRVLIARALVREPSVLILDEPLAGVDRANREALAEILATLRSNGMTLLTVLHEMGELLPVIERAIVLREGRLVYDGDAASLSPAHHDHEQHDLVGHDVADDCDHHHPHMSDSQVAHHAPVLRPSLRTLSDAPSTVPTGEDAS